MIEGVYSIKPADIIARVALENIDAAANKKEGKFNPGEADIIKQQMSIDSSLSPAKSPQASHRKASQSPKRSHGSPPPIHVSQPMMAQVPESIREKTTLNMHSVSGSIKEEDDFATDHKDMSISIAKSPDIEMFNSEN